MPTSFEKTYFDSWVREWVSGTGFEVRGSWVERDYDVNCPNRSVITVCMEGDGDLTSALRDRRDELTGGLRWLDATSVEGRAEVVLEVFVLPPAKKSARDSRSLCDRIGSVWSFAIPESLETACRERVQLQPTLSEMSAHEAKRRDVERRERAIEKIRERVLESDVR